MMVTHTARLAMVTAALWLGFGVGSPAEAGTALPTPSGLSPGDHFRFAFVTDGTTPATSSNIVDYNSFVNTQAGGATYNGTTITWAAIGSTPTVNAIDNVVRTQDPVYLADGTQVTTTTTSSGLWSGTILNPIDRDLAGQFIATVVWTGTLTDGTGAPNQQLGQHGIGGGPVTGSSSTHVPGFWVEEGIRRIRHAAPPLRHFA